MSRLQQDERWLWLRSLSVVAPRYEGDRLALGGMSFGGEARLVRDGDWLTIVHDGWRVERFVRYRPLVYFAAFGGSAAFDCLQLAVTSLFEFGAYDGDVLVLTDEAHRDWPEALPGAWRSRVATRALAADDMLDWTLARYRLGEFAEFGSFRPYLYLDIDVVCNGDIGPLLRHLAISETLHAPAENAVTSADASYGASLLVADRLHVPPEVRGFSTGLMGFPRLDTVTSLFRLVPDLAYAYAQRVGKRDTFACFDQPFANYAAFKTCRVELTLLGRYLDNRWYWFERLPVRRGLTHFTGGTSAAGPKATTMAAYIERLRTTEATAAGA